MEMAQAYDSKHFSPSTNPKNFSATNLLLFVIFLALSVESSRGYDYGAAAAAALPCLSKSISLYVSSSRSISSFLLTTFPNCFFKGLKILS
jgi:hypothetical protein